MLLAYLPFMVYPYDLFRTGAAALWIVIFLWITVAFFWFTRCLFPDRFLKHAFFLRLIVWAQAVWTLTKLPPYWILSVFFLAPVSFLENTAKPSHVRMFSREVPRSQYPSIGAERRLGPSSPNPPINRRVGWDCPGLLIKKLLESQGRLPFLKRKKKFGRSQYPSIGAERRLGPSKLPFLKRKKKFGRYFLERAMVGVGFVGFVVFLAIVREIGEKRLGIQAFEQPAGMLLVIAAIAFLWKNQPYRR